MGQIGEAIFAGSLLLAGGAVGDRIALAENGAAVQNAQNLATEMGDVAEDVPDGRLYGEDALTVLKVMAATDSLTTDDPIQVVKVGDAFAVDAIMPASEIAALAADNVADAENKQNNQRWLYRALGASAFEAMGYGLRFVGRWLI